MSGQLWKVVGGAEKGGVLAREGQDTKSAELADRLSTEALVKEISLVGERLQYELVVGKGPRTGWVSTRLKDKELVVKYDAPEVSLAPAADVWRVLYYGVPTRGEQLRLLFRLTGTPFEDVRLTNFPHDLDPYRSCVVGDKSPLVFDECPLLQFNDISIVQVAAAMQYVGEKLGLVDDNPEARAKAAMFMLGSEELRNFVFYPAFNAINTTVADCNAAGMDQASLISKLGEQQPTFCRDYERYDRFMSHFERHFRATSNQFLLGHKECYADIGLYDSITAIWGLPICEKVNERKKKYPLLVEFVKRIRALPKLKEYIDARGEFWGAINKAWSGEPPPP